MSEGYNGWTNWETWNLALWADNDEGTYRFIMENKPYTPDTARDTAFELFPNGTPDMKGAQDMCKVNWEEIAEAWNEE